MTPYLQACAALNVPTMVIEAGGLVTDFVGGHNHSNSGNIVASSPRLAKEILKDIRPHLGEALSK